jgi:hypothetical protein
MRFVDPPTLDTPRRGRPGDELDGLLSAFFRSEMPDPWPAAHVPEEAEPATIPLRSLDRKPLRRSRLALAASVALFVALPWLQSGPPDDSTPPGASPSLETGEATTRFKETIDVKDGKASWRIDVFQQTKDMLPD